MTFSPPNREASSPRSGSFHPRTSLRPIPRFIPPGWCGKPFDRASFDKRPGWDKLSAVKKGRIHEMDPSIILQPGPACLTDGLAELERLLGA